jgi:hypothetical protein
MAIRIGKSTGEWMRLRSYKLLVYVKYSKLVLHNLGYYLRTYFRSRDIIIEAAGKVRCEVFEASEEILFVCMAVRACNATFSVILSGNVNRDIPICFSPYFSPTGAHICQETGNLLFRNEEFKDLRPFEALCFTTYTMGYNITITVPNGTVYYQEPNQLCLPAMWSDIIIFFSANYLAHAATVRSKPSESFLASFARSIIGLFFPAYGLVKATWMIVSCATFVGLFSSEVPPKNLLRGATIAGALITVVRSHSEEDTWKPNPENKLPDALLRAPKNYKPPAPGMC